MQFQIVKVPEISAFRQRFIARKHDSKLSFDHAVLILVANTHHQRGAAIQRRDYHRPAKHDARDGAREADENQSGHHREQKHARHDFEGGDDVTVQSLRIHVAVAHSGQRLDTEEEAVEKPVWRRPGNTISAKAVKNREKQI